MLTALPKNQSCLCAGWQTVWHSHLNFVSGVLLGITQLPGLVSTGLPLGGQLEDTTFSQDNSQSLHLTSSPLSNSSRAVGFYFHFQFPFTCSDSHARIPGHPSMCPEELLTATNPYCKIFIHRRILLPTLQTDAIVSHFSHSQ